MASAWLKLILQNPQNEYREQNVDRKQKRKTVVTAVDFFSDWKSLKSATAEVPGSLFHSDSGLFPAATRRISNEPSVDGEGNTFILN